VSTLILIILAVALFAFGVVCGLEQCDHISRWEEEAREALAAEKKRREEAEREVKSRDRDALAWDRTVRTLSHKVVAAEADNARLREALDGLQRSEAAYRMAHDVHGDRSLVAGRCWDLLRRAGDKARVVLAKPEGGAL